MTTKNRPEALEIAEELVGRLLEKHPIAEEKKRSTFHYEGQLHNMPLVQNAEIALEMILRAAHWLAGADDGMASDPPDFAGYFG